MNKQLTKLFVALFVALIATSALTTLPTQATAQDADREEAMYIMGNILPIDLTKYKIRLISDSVLQGFPLGDNDRQIHDLLYKLISEDNDSEVHVSFAFEKGIMTSCLINNLRGRYYQQQPVYDNTRDAVVAFLEKYQTYTKLGSSNLIAMLDNVDITQDISTTTNENIKLTVENYSYAAESYTLYVWTDVFNDVEYTSLNVRFDSFGQLCSFGDSRLLYNIGDISSKISMEQAVDIAIEHLGSYSYEMPDGSVVSNFNVDKNAALAELFVVPVNFVDYVLRPYWDVTLYLDEVYPGNVFAIKAFIWADTGEIQSYSNMATGGFSTTGEDTNNKSNSNMLFIGIAAIAVIAVATTGILLVRKKHK